MISSPAGEALSKLPWMKYLRGFDLASYLALMAFLGYLAVTLLA
jgi:hypothetical protein